MFSAEAERSSEPRRIKPSLEIGRQQRNRRHGKNDSIALCLKRCIQSSKQQQHFTWLGPLRGYTKHANRHEQQQQQRSIRSQMKVRGQPIDDEVLKNWRPKYGYRLRVKLDAVRIH